MPNSKKRCKYCKEYVGEWIKVPAGIFCTRLHAAKWAEEKRDRERAKRLEAAKKERRKETRQKKKEVRSRTKWFDMIKTEVHWYVKHVLYPGYPCYTCDKPQGQAKARSFQAGHFMPAKQADPRRFMLENLRMQCSVCNCHNSGRQGEYEKRMRLEMGDEHVDWLMREANFKPLKEQFPTWQDLEAELRRWQKINREARKALDE